MVADTKELRDLLEKEIPVLKAQIRALYLELDKKLHLHGADVPVTFGYDTSQLGSYTRKGQGEMEHFHFSLLFIGYSVKKPLSKEERMDLFKHEYAHYMQYNMFIPAEYQWQPGIHGSAWKYCCSLVGAAPTPYYKAGEALMKHDYQKVLKNKVEDKTIPMTDRYRREKEYKENKNRQIQFQVGEEVRHPKFGTGTVQKIEQLTGSVRLYIQFGEMLKAIDQKWLLMQNYKK